MVDLNFRKLLSFFATGNFHFSFYALRVQARFMGQNAICNCLVGTIGTIGLWIVWWGRRLNFEHSISEVKHFKFKESYSFLCHHTYEANIEGTYSFVFQLSIPFTL